jgi:hypothetical protein
MIVAMRNPPIIAPPFGTQLGFNAHLLTDSLAEEYRYRQR